MDIDKLIAINQKKMVITRNAISKLDVNIQCLNMEMKALQKDCDRKVKELKYKELNLQIDKEELLTELNDCRQKIVDLQSQL